MLFKYKITPVLQGIIVTAFNVITVQYLSCRSICWCKQSKNKCSGERSHSSDGEKTALLKLWVCTLKLRWVYLTTVLPYPPLERCGVWFSVLVVDLWFSGSEQIDNSIDVVAINWGLECLSWKYTRPKNYLLPLSCGGMNICTYSWIKCVYKLHNVSTK